MDDAASLANLPDDPATLKAVIATLARRFDDVSLRCDEALRKSRELEVQKLRLEVELLRLKKLYYGPRADRLVTPGDVAQMLLQFSGELDARPVDPQDLPPAAGAAGGGVAAQGNAVRRVRRGRRDLAALEHLPVTRHVHDLGEDDKPCPCCGAMREQIGRESSWQVEYVPGHFERLEHVRIKYACRRCERHAEPPRIVLADKPGQPIDKGLAGPGLLAYVVTSKYADYLPLYRLEAIFARNGFEVDRATQGVWCGDVSDLVKPLYDRMVRRVLASHVVGTDDTVMPMLAPGKAKQARMWVYLGDEHNPYNVFDFSVRGKALPEMRVGLSQPDDRIRLQTSPNCGGKEPSWETSGAKGAARPRQVRIGKTNESEPPMKCRENLNGVETGEMKWPREQRRRCLFTADVTSGIEAASVRSGLGYGTSEPVVPMAREKSKRTHRKDESTDAGHRGGTIRSSVERRVTRPERRDRVIQLSSNGSTAQAGGTYA